nr:hypothetical protein [uncultured Desulfobacter sp.]
MRVKIGFKILIIWITAALLIGGCSKNLEISNETIENEIRYAWKSIHGESGQKGYRWKLDNVRPIKKTYNDKRNKVRVEVLFKYRDAANKPLERSVDFIFYLKGKTWRLEDRDARNMSSSTRYNITP